MVGSAIPAPSSDTVDKRRSTAPKAQRHYQEARLGYVRAEAQRYQDTIQLWVAMGGGWWDAASAFVQ